ncbi:MAG: hypothetical protein Kow0069_17290 [Promethearchaeota archaeon]
MGGGHVELVSPKIVGTLARDDEGQLALRMRISPQNPQLYDVPLSELLEDFEGKLVRLEVWPVVPVWKEREREARTRRGGEGTPGGATGG